MRSARTGGRERRVERQTAPSEGGWALLEVLAALLLVSLAALSLAGAVLTAGKVARRAGQVAAAAAAAQQKLEELRDLPFSHPALDPATCGQSSPCSWTPAGDPAWPLAGRYYVDVRDGTGNPLPAGVRRVVVEVLRPGETHPAVRVTGYVREP